MNTQSTEMNTQSTEMNTQSTEMNTYGGLEFIKVYSCKDTVNIRKMRTK